MIIDLNSAKTNEPEDIEVLQKETLQSIAEYIPNLISGINTVVPELRGEEKEDTWEYLRMIIDGFNWVIDAYNGTSSLINNDKETIDEADISDKNNKLGKAYTSKNGTDVADSLEKDIVPFLNKLMEIASKF